MDCLIAPECVSGTEAMADDPIPLVIVEGFLGSAGAAMGYKFAEYLDKGNTSRKTMFASVGPVSSLHDRACELFYTLLGGAVDYGEDHAEAHGHQRFGRVVDDALYPSWSLDNPLHFLGHSMGGPTIIKLQSLMAAGFFGDCGHPDMILSLSSWYVPWRYTTLSAPFRGTQLVYALGERTDSAPAVRPFSAGALLSRIIHVLSYLSPLLPAALDLHVESRPLQERLGTEPDATPYDATFQAAEEREVDGEGQPHQMTFYRSYTASLRHTERDRSCRNFIANILSPLYISSLVMSSFNFSVLQPTPAIVASAGYPSTGGEHCYWENDGVVPVFSQFHPFRCSTALCRHHSKRIHTGIPYPGICHFSIAPFWWGSRRQRAFWLELGHWLRAIDHQRLILW
ncbi:alpha beta-hydrolase [Suillus lakei]|nr:alpha beta-hydrolase [Suillus lakei]